MNSHKLPPISFIWRDATSRARPNSWTYFRKVFFWDGGSSDILFSADPTARLYLNGQVVIPRVMRFVTPHITVESLDLKPYLVKGKNVAVVLHHWWGVRTFQRSRGGEPGVGIESTFLKTDPTWRWCVASEFADHPHQTIGGGAQRIRFPVVLDACRQNELIHSPDYDDRKWKRVQKRSSVAWSQPVLKETPRLERIEVFPMKVEALGTVSTSGISPPPFPAVPTSWLAKNGCYRRDAGRAADVGNLCSPDGAGAILKPGADGYVTLDFGRPVHGYICIEAGPASPGTVLDLTFCEIRNDLHTQKPVLKRDGSFDPELVVGGPFGDRIILGDQPQLVEVPEERTCRWLMLTWRNARQPVHLKKVSLFTSQHPTTTIGAFSGGPDAVDSLVKLALDHAKVTMSDTYVDTPGREDAQWLEDIPDRARITSSWFGDSRLRQVTLRHAIEQQAPNGRFRIFPPEDYGENGLQCLDWGMAWVELLHDDWTWTGQTSRARQYFPNLIRFLEAAHTQTNAQGMLVDRTCLSDIRCAARPNFDWGELESIPNAWYYGCLLRAVDIAQAVRNKRYAGIWRQRASLIRTGFRKFCITHGRGNLAIAEIWSPARGAFSFGQAAAISAVYYKLIDDGDAKRALNAAFAKSDGSPPKDWHRWNNPTYAYRLLRSLCDHGFGRVAARHLLERYGPYLPDGPLPEYFIPGAGQPDDGSGSHGWAASPLGWLHDTVLGVCIKRDSRLAINWNPVYVGWPKIKGIVCTPLGNVHVSSDWTRGIHRLEGSKNLVKALSIQPTNTPSLAAKLTQQKSTSKSLNFKFLIENHYPAKT